jgi:hypothetical protein
MSLDYISQKVSKAQFSILGIFLSYFRSIFIGGFLNFDFVSSLFQEESVIDLTKEEISQFDLIHEFETEDLSLCRGRLKNVNVEPKFHNDFLIERLEEDVVLRSLNCTYVLRGSSESQRKICDFCQNLEDFCRSETDLKKDTLSNEDTIRMDEKEVSDVVVKTEPLSNVLETANTDNEEVKSEEASTLLQKLKSLNLPVTVSLSANPPSKLKVKSELNGKVVVRKSIADPLSKSINSLSTVVVKKKNKRENVIELTGKTVTNRCSWCGSVFHRLYLFKDHLKVPYRSYVTCFDYSLIISVQIKSK